MSFYARVSLTVILVIAFGFDSDAFSQRRRRAPRPAAAPKKLSVDQERRVETFEKVWRTIYHYYFDKSFNNVNWQLIKAEFEPRVRSAKTDDDLHELLDTMISRLGVSHLAIIRPTVYEAIEAAKKTARERAAERAREKGDPAPSDGAAEEDEELNFDDPLSIYGPGVDLRIVGNRFVVFRVAANSAAEYAGIKLGDIVETVDGVSLTLLLARISLLETSGSRVQRYLPIEVVNEMLNGDKDTTVRIGYLDGNDKANEVEIRRERLRTQTVSIGSEVPEDQLRFVSRSLNSDTGYIHFDNFSLPVIEKFCSAITEFQEKESLIIDLRGNLGGVIGVSIGLAGMLSETPMSMGTSIMRYGSERLVSQPKPKRFAGRIVVLIDGLSVSAAEMFAVALQSSGRALIVGERSAGETLPAVAVELPTGARLYYPIANFRAPNGRFLEGLGVKPDKVVVLDRASLNKGIDPQLAAALAVLASSAKNATLKGIDAPPVELSGPIAKVPKGESGIGAPPPPPKPAQKPLRNLGTVNVAVPAIPAQEPDVIEPKASELLLRFEKLSGGFDAYSAISSYEMTGTVETVIMGSKDVKTYKVFREGTTRHLIVLNSDATGDIRDFRDGKTRNIKSDFGLELEVPFKLPIAEADFLYSITRSMKLENYSKLLYLGIFDRGERKVHLIDGKTKEGVTVAIYFDAETNMLAGFEGPSGGLSFSDYRRVGDLMMPYNISSQDFLNIELSEIKINPKIDPAVFERKVNCYDKP